MRIFNRFAIGFLDAENGSRVFPNADQVVTSTSVETTTDGNITLQRTWGYNAGEEVVTRSEWSIVNLPTMASIAYITDAYEITGTNFVENSQLFLEFIPDCNIGFGSNQISGHSADGYRFLLEDTYNSSTSIEFVWSTDVIKQLKEGGNYPRLLKGEARLVYQDLTKEIEIFLPIIVEEDGPNSFTLSS